MSTTRDLGQWPVTRESAALVTASWFVDVWREVEARQARDRADAFEAAKPRPDDYPGLKSSEELREDWHRCHAVAEAYRAKAQLLNDQLLATGLEQMHSTEAA